MTIPTPDELDKRLEKLRQTRKSILDLESLMGPIHPTSLGTISPEDIKKYHELWIHRVEVGDIRVETAEELFSWLLKEVEERYDRLQQNTVFDDPASDD